MRLLAKDSAALLCSSGSNDRILVSNCMPRWNYQASITMATAISSNQASNGRYDAGCSGLFSCAGIAADLQADFGPVAFWLVQGQTLQVGGAGHGAGHIDAGKKRHQDIAFGGQL